VLSRFMSSPTSAGGEGEAGPKMLSVVMGGIGSNGRTGSRPRDSKYCSRAMSSSCFLATAGVTILLQHSQRTLRGILAVDKCMEKVRGSEVVWYTDLPSDQSRVR